MNSLIESGLIPDALIRAGIRVVSRMRLFEQHRNGDLTRFLNQMEQSPIATNTDDANDQHYELPPGFFELVLGRNLKYSSCYWDDQTQSLDQAEAKMLELTIGRARIADGDQVLELGCGWGSLTVAMARQFPNSQFTAVSNSAPQRRYIEARLAAEGLGNVRVITADMNNFDPVDRFDRVVSVEMFEHMRNYRELLARVTSWLKPGGTIFIHIFCHRKFVYPYEIKDATDWMARYFFTGGMMPSFDIFENYPDIVRLDSLWKVDGTHYKHTANAWLNNMDRHRDRIMDIFENTYGTEQATRWFRYWRVFFMACAEMFGLRNGQEWFVGHYLLRPAADVRDGRDHQKAA